MSNNLNDAMGRFKTMIENGDIQLTAVEVVQLLQHAATREDISSLDDKIESKIERLDTKIDDKFDKLDKKIDDKFDILVSKIDAINSRFGDTDGKTVSKHISNEINNSTDKITSKLSKLTSILLTVSGGLAIAIWYIATHIDKIIDILHILSKS